MSVSIIPPHVLTGREHNSGLHGASERVIAHRLEKSRGTTPVIVSSTCGTQLTVTQEVITDLEKFAIRYVYDDTVMQDTEMRRLRSTVQTCA